MDLATPGKVEAAAYALFRRDAAKHPVKLSESAKAAVWKRTAPSYRKAASLALQAAQTAPDELPEPEPADRDPGPDAPPLALTMDL